jgi:hypothetical protein
MMSLEQKSSLLLFLIVLVSCGSKTFDTSEQIATYIDDEENGYKYSKTINNVEYSLTYKPTDLIVKQELGDKFDAKKVKELRENYNKYMYFNLTMSMNNKELLTSLASDKTRFGQMVNDLAFGMEEKVHLYSKQKDTLEMADFIYPRMYGMTNDTSLLIVYPRDKKYLKDDYLNFTIEDIGLNTGEVKFKIDTKQLLEEPKLSFE